MAPSVFDGVIFAMKIVTDVHLGSDDRLDPIVFGLGVEFDRSVEGGGVGEGERGLSEFLGMRQELFRSAERGQQGIVRVDVKVGEVHMKSDIGFVICGYCEEGYRCFF